MSLNRENQKQIRLEALKKTMIARSNEVPARAAQESLRLLGSLEKDIPVIKALTNEHLKDRHWWQVSFAEAGRSRSRSTTSKPRNGMSSVWE